MFTLQPFDLSLYQLARLHCRPYCTVLYCMCETAWTAINIRTLSSILSLRQWLFSVWISSAPTTLSTTMLILILPSKSYFLRSEGIWAHTTWLLGPTLVHTPNRLTRLVQPFLYSTPVWPTQRQTDRQTHTHRETLCIDICKNSSQLTSITACSAGDADWIFIQECCDGQPINSLSIIY